MASVRLKGLVMFASSNCRALCEAKPRLNPMWSLTPRSTPTRYGRRCKAGLRYFVLCSHPSLTAPTSAGGVTSNVRPPFIELSLAGALPVFGDFGCPPPGAPRFAAPPAVTHFGTAFGALGVQSQLWLALRACRPLTLVRLRQHFSARRFRSTRNSLRVAPRTSLAPAALQCSQASLHRPSAPASAVHVARLGHTGRPNPSVNADPLRQAL
jgi:hypothetical protein